MLDKNGFIVRLCKRGEAWCGVLLREGVCGEPAAVAYKPSKHSRPDYACAEHYGYEETQALRAAGEPSE